MTKMPLTPGITPVCEGNRYWSSPRKEGQRTFSLFSLKAPISKSADLMYLVVTILYGADQMRTEGFKA